MKMSIKMYQRVTRVALLTVLTVGLLFVVGLCGNDKSAYAAESNVTRYGGEDRYETAVEISKKAFTGTNPTAIVAYGGRFPDALAGSGLAGAVNAPILLTDLDALPAVTATELTRLAPATVYILGSTGAVSNAVAEQIAALPSQPQIVRLGGESRYETAKLIADEVVKQGGSTTEAYIAYGGTFADAASLSSFAASQKVPILLADGEGLSAASVDFIKTNGTKDVTIAGGTSAVPANTEAQLSELGVTSTTRKGGTNRYDTCEQLATGLVEKYHLTVFLIGVAIGEGDRFPDALTGGAAAGVRGGVVVISSSNDSDFVTRVVASLTSETKARIEIYGKEGAVSDTVEENLAVVAPRPYATDDFPRTYIGTKGGYIEIVDTVLYIHSGGANTDAEMFLDHLYSKILNLGYENGRSLPVTVSAMAEVFDTYDFFNMPNYMLPDGRSAYIPEQVFINIVSKFFYLHLDGRTFFTNDGVFYNASKTKGIVVFL
jgi:putative cell wall-binding protein